MNTDLAGIQRQLDQLEARFSKEVEAARLLQSRLDKTEQCYQRAEVQLRQARFRLRIQAGLAFTVTVLAVILAPASRIALAQSGLTLQELANRVNLLQRSLTSLQSRVVTLETKTQFMSADSTALTTTFSNCNILIQSGSGRTDDGTLDPNGNPLPGKMPTGLGNLIIGYNAAGNDQGMGDVRIGSHNLILGDQNNYSSCGGLIAGVDNSISGPYAVVSGGAVNSAAGLVASVSGGAYNSASGEVSGVSGGLRNMAQGECATVGGGEGNLSSGFAAVVSGGLDNTAGAIASTVSGGGGKAGGQGITIGATGKGASWAAGGTGAGIYHAP